MCSLTNFSFISVLSRPISARKASVSGSRPCPRFSISLSNLCRTPYEVIPISFKLSSFIVLRMPKLMWLSLSASFTLWLSRPISLRKVSKSGSRTTFSLSGPLVVSEGISIWKYYNNIPEESYAMPSFEFCVLYFKAHLEKMFLVL